MKKILLSLIAGMIALPLLGEILVKDAEARQFSYKVCKKSVQATGRAGGPNFSYQFKKRRAVRKARHNWRSKVRALYGYRFTRWGNARYKRVSCEGAAGSVYCSVRAKPCKRVFRIRHLKLR